MSIAINATPTAENSRLVASGTIDIPTISIGSIDAEVQPYSIAHNLGYVPVFLMYALIPNPDNQATQAFADEYYVPLPPIFTYTEAGGSGLQYTFAVGADETNLYFVRSIFNGGGSTATGASGTMKYYVYAATAN